MESVGSELFARATRCGWYRGRYYQCNSRWSSWGRYVLAGAIVLILLIVILSCCCLARRRRKSGTKPYYGTGWMAPTGKFGPGTTGGHNMDNHQTGTYATGNPDYSNTGGVPPYNPPPAYGSNEPQYGSSNATYGGSNEGYYNSSYNTGLQEPPNAYRGDGIYPPPPGAPGQK